MNKQEEFKRVCNLSGLIRINDNIYSTPDKLECIEMKGERYLTFWNKCGERIYDQPVGSKIELVLRGLNEGKTQTIKDIKTEDTKKPDEAKGVNVETKPAIADNNITPYMPDSISNLVFQKWQKMPVEERLIMLQTTDKRYIEERKGKGGKYKYVTGHYMTMCANMAFGFSWSSQVQQWEKTDTEIICMGYIETKINGELIRKYAIGQQDIAFTTGTKIPVCLGDNYKAAEMDMIKKALSFFGIAKDVYSGDV